jgi:NodT family efflux transporter outer membrane factor (OMF) lipoprotein
LIELARHQNLPLQIAAVRILEARAQLGIASARFWPQNPGPIGQVSAGGLKNSDLNLYYWSYQFGFDALWEPDFWGKFRRGARAAHASYLATVADYDDAIVSLSAEAARLYLVIRTFEVLIDLTVANVAVQEDGLRIAESRFRNGATSELDVAQAANLLETTRASVPELQISLQQAHNALCTLLGQTTGCAQSLLVGTKQIPVTPAQVAVSVPAELLRRRPDIRGAELQAMAQCDRIGVAKAELFPSFTLSGSIGTRTVGTSGAPSGLSSILNIFNPGTLLYSIGAGLFWPILNYPRILNNVRVEDARFQQSLFHYQNTVLRAAQEVEDGIVGFLKEQEAAVFAENAVNAAQTSVKLAMIQYREGAVDFQRVLDAERSLLVSQTGLARTRSSVATNLIALYKALGGGWQSRQGEPIVSDGVKAEMQKRTNWGSYFSEPPAPRKANGPPPAQR